MPLKNLNEAPIYNGTITFNDLVRFSKGADIASANALVLGTDGNYFDVTGTTSITSIGTTGHVGTWIKLHFDGILTFTHHATDLILPGGANITTAAGDEAELVEYASGDWRCVSYTKADGTAVVGSAGFAVNVETLAGNKTIADGDPQMQILDPGGANRDVYLPASPSADAEFTIVNTNTPGSVRYLEVQISGDTNYFTRIYSSGSATFAYDSTDTLWRWVGPGSLRTRTAADTYDTGDRAVVIGYDAQAGEYATAVGRGADGGDYSVVMGYGAEANTSGVAVGWESDGGATGVAVGYLANGATNGAALGYQADANTGGVALGRQADTNLNNYATAIGFNSDVQRYGTVAKGCSRLAPIKERTFEAYWADAIAGGAGATEIFLRDQSSNRCTVLASSSMAFTIVVVARDGTADESARYTFEGLITRDGSNNTTMKWISKNVDFEDDNTWDVDVTADDTNEALIVTCTPDAANETRFYAHGICREVTE